MYNKQRVSKYAMFTIEWLQDLYVLVSKLQKACVLGFQPLDMFKTEVQRKKE